MRTTQEILKLLGHAKPELARRFGVKRLAVFGSYARGEQREESDVDILVEVDPSIGLGFVDLAESIESLLGLRSEVVSRRAIKPRNWEVIEKELIDVL
jgi:predicted nucleotidyltransferase